MIQDRSRLIVVATRNPGKILEIQEIVGNIPGNFLPVHKLEPDFYVEEDGTTYAENAIKKAKAAVERTQCLAIADDSGLEIEALQGAPGIYSARFGGQTLSQSEKNTLLLRQMNGITNRSARFRCVIAVVSPKGHVETTEGVCEGYIGTEARGIYGFGFDPIFIVPEFNKTMAELESDIKNTISHRAKALQGLPHILKHFLIS